jgi:predicted alpha/beta-hydrolase family hydrolase
MQWYIYPAITSDAMSTATLVNLVLLHGAGAPIQQPVLQALISALNTMQINVYAGNFAYMEQVRQGQRRPPPALDKLQLELAQGLQDLLSAAPLQKDLSDAAPWFIAGKSMGSRVAFGHVVNANTALKTAHKTTQKAALEEVAEGLREGDQEGAWRSAHPQIPAMDRLNWRGVIALGFPFVPPATLLKAKANASSTAPSMLWLELADKRTQDFAKLAVPGLILQGERDAFGGKSQLQSAEFKAKSSLWPNIKLQLVAGACHDFKFVKSLQSQAPSAKNNEASRIYELAMQIRSFIDAVL